MELTSSATRNYERVCVIGLGYIGLPTAAFIASKGIQVVGVDINKAYVEQINAGKVPFFEPGFDSLLEKVVQNETLSAQDSPTTAEAYIIAVPTPFNEDKSVDTSYINSAVRSLAPHLRPGALIVLESTSPPGTTERMAELIIQERPDLTLNPKDRNHILVAHCPERVLPGQIMAEMENNARVIGGVTPKAGEAARQLYETFCSGEILLTDAPTAEMAKLAENSFRDVNIAFANELSLISDDLGIDVWELISLANHHPRVNILQPGPGVGGHCIAVDPWFIVSSAPTNSRLIQTAREVNDQKPLWVIDKVKAMLSDYSSPKIAALGVAFKPDIDDLRESPSLKIVEQLAQEISSAELLVVEPNIESLPASSEAIPNIKLSTFDEACKVADLILILVDHQEFKTADHSQYSNALIVDTKGIWGK